MNTKITERDELTEIDVTRGCAERCRGCGHIQDGQAGQCSSCGECDTVTGEPRWEDDADQIANSHGCDLQPDASGRMHIVVQGYHSQGSPADDRRIARCRAALEAAGISLK